MKYLYKNFWALALLFAALFSLSSCVRDEDDRIGYDVKGHWFGDMDMFFNDERAQGSEIEFKNTGWGYDRGTGVEVDYYRFHAVTNYFNWRVVNRVIYLTFEDEDLDCAIVDYSLGYDYFRGFIADYHTLENQTPFNLRNYDRYWNEYGYAYNYNNYYNDYYDYYYVKGTRIPCDSSAVVPSDSAALPSSSSAAVPSSSSAAVPSDLSEVNSPSYRGIRGVNLPKYQQ